jgi:hypothetical protein
MLADLRQKGIITQKANKMHEFLLAQLGPSHIVGTIILVLDIIAIMSVLLGHGSLGHKLLWILLVLLLPLIGMILYFLFGRNAADA